MSVTSNMASTMMMSTSHGEPDCKSGRLAWHCQSIRITLPQQCYSIAGALQTLRLQRQPVYE